MKKKQTGLYIVVGLIVASVLSLTLAALGKRQDEPAQIAGRVIDRNTGAPLAAELSLVLRGANGITIRHIRASDQGVFEIPNLRAGDVMLTTKMEGYAAERQRLSIDKSESRPVEFQLRRSGSLRGGIIGPSGEPIADAQIRVIYAEEPNAQNGVSASYQWESGEVRTDSTGAFVVDVHPEKEFVIEAWRPGFLAGISSPIEMAPAEKRASVYVALRRGKRIAGEVQDEAGNPVAGAQVRLSTDGTGPELNRFVSFAMLEQSFLSTVTDLNGRYEFIQAPADVRTMNVSHPKFRPLRRELQSGFERQSGLYILTPKNQAER